MKKIEIMTLLIDIGGVLLTDGWGHESRKLAAQTFNLDLNEINERHQKVDGLYEEGNLTLEKYLEMVIFYCERSFSRTEFRKFMFEQSNPQPQMIEFVRKLKAKYGLKIVAVSNESREMNDYRIQKFKLYEFVDSFISSCFVHVRKPNPDIFRLALDISQTHVENAVYIENTPMFVRIAEDLGIQSILHTDYTSTCKKMVSFGLEET